jgi:CubicO group peptidase (beta-lactamase class C family)
MALDSGHWQERLTLLADKHGVIGASLALSQGGELATGATGVLNLRTGHPVTPDSVFLIGSITKVWTATLVMQLVDEELVDLDAPLMTYLPSFKVADPVVSTTVTARQLLCHSSGIDGDFFLDTGRGDDALGRFVGAMGELTQNHPQGAIMSYTNSGYAVLGHMVATLRGATWEEVLRERLFAPLELGSAGTLPEEAIVRSVAVGHLGEDVSDQWGGPRSMGPTGLIHATPQDLVTFARLHMSAGVTRAGTRILTAASAAAMTTAQIETKDLTEGTHWGLGWALDSWDGQAVYGHSGSLTGQLAFLRVLPASDLVFALTTNGGRDQGPAELYEALVTEVAAELAGATARVSLQPPATEIPVDVARFAGTYTRSGFQATVGASPSGGAQVAVKVTGGLVGFVPDMTIELIGYDGSDLLLGRFEGTDTWMPVIFFEMDGERYFHAAARAFHRTSD